MTNQQKRLQAAIRAGRKAWERLHEARWAFIRACDQCTREEKIQVFGDHIPDREFFDNLGA